MTHLLETFTHLAEKVTIPAQQTLFAEGDAPDFAYVLLSGTCILSRDLTPLSNAPRDSLLDELAILGDVPHTQRAITQSDCTFLRWESATLRQNPDFSILARQHLAAQLQATQSRLNDLEAHVHYQPYSADLRPGPFVFNNSAIIFCFGTADIPHLSLPDGVQRAGSSLLLAFADFRDAYYANQPDLRFSYTETTIFLPVRVGAKLGLYVPYIYPSTYEPILLGREIYGFPKRLGLTTLSANSASLLVQGDPYLRAEWQTRETATEARIVGAFGRLFGAPNMLTSAAFRIGDTMLTAMGVPFYRRIGVYNRKRIIGIESKNDAPTYDVDLLTQAIFSVNRWHNVTHLPDASLTIGTVLTGWRVTLREAYHTTLDMRLSTGRKIRDYLGPC